MQFNRQTSDPDDRDYAEDDTFTEAIQEAEESLDFEVLTDVTLRAFPEYEKVRDDVRELVHCSVAFLHRYYRKEEDWPSIGGLALLPKWRHAFLVRMKEILIEYEIGK